MSALNGFSPLPPLFAPMNPLTQNTSDDDGDVLVRCQSAASTALEHSIQRPLGDSCADINTARAAAVPHQDPAPMAQAKEDSQAEEVKEESIDGGTVRSRSVRKKRKQASPPPSSSDEDSAPQTRLEKNRKSAREYRKRKKFYFKNLESENDSLKKRVKSLTQLLNASQYKVGELTQHVTKLNKALRRQKGMGFSYLGTP